MEEGGSWEREKGPYRRAKGPSSAVISRWQAFDAEKTGSTSKGKGDDAWRCAGRSNARNQCNEYPIHVERLKECLSQ
jgi:hypothetical protein